MTHPMPIVTLHIAASQMSVVLARLTTFLLHARYAFLQTFHSAEHTDVDIFDQHQQQLVRCTLRVADTAAPVPVLSMSATPGALAADLMALLHDLAPGGTSTAEGQ